LKLLDRLWVVTQDDAELEPCGVDCLEFWLHYVHAFTASYSAGGSAAGALGGGGPAAVGRLSPAVFIVGTSRASLHDDVEQQLIIVSHGSHAILPTSCGRVVQLIVDRL